MCILLLIKTLDWMLMEKSCKKSAGSRTVFRSQNEDKHSASVSCENSKREKNTVKKDY